MPKLVHIKPNPDVLTWARESIALNRTNAAERTKISPARLKSLEEGNRHPTLGELKAMSKEYKRTIATLLLREPPKEKPLPKDKRTLNSDEIGGFHEKTILAVRKARANLTSLLELKKEMDSPIISFSYSAKLSDDPSESAKNFRRLCNISELRELDNPNDALEACIEKVENLGVAIFQLSLTQDKLRGFSLVDETIPIIVIKRGGESGASKIFTLFHELGHILLNDGGLCDITQNPKGLNEEKWCNAFAAELLIPSSELLKIDIIRKQVADNQKYWRKDDLIDIGNIFHVGPLTVLRRLLHHHLTTSSFYQEKHELWNKPSFGRAKNPAGRQIPKEVLSEKGRSYVHLAFKAFDQNKIDVKDLSDFLGIKLSYLPKTRQLLSR